MLFFFWLNKGGEVITGEIKDLLKIKSYSLSENSSVSLGRQK